MICWLTRYDLNGLEKQIEQGNDFETFFTQAPLFNPNSTLITGVVCGIRVEEIENLLMKKVRYLDKLVDELASFCAHTASIVHAHPVRGFEGCSVYENL